MKQIMKRNFFNLKTEIYIERSVGHGYFLAKALWFKLLDRLVSNCKVLKKTSKLFKTKLRGNGGGNLIFINPQQYISSIDPLLKSYH